ncbi:nuclear transport factor 2 family protein [Nocardioides albus]|uniref:Putative ester cyclase n=1 Tax=Nocardioides albus TaxID=1841 RepID=A0A7W5FA12_9ACTN|nr:nuclear transport factor 2 family protein [Nocardioides albus]MBB3090849.1 putative ester cyclase [Nocardioides albus]GGU37899.1 hypothetical protein GCM10007979_41230 [Nocardioides albus]
MPDHETLHRVASTFHKNFNAGRFDDNGPLVAEEISVDSNTVRFTGRSRFLERIRRFDGPFPGMQLRDRMILIDGMKAGVHYIMQGEHGGQFGDLSPTGRKVEIRGAEIFTFNDEAQMADLVTVNELDRLKAQVSGRESIAEHADITPVDPGSPHVGHGIAQRERVHQLYDSLSQGDHDAAMVLVAEDIVVQPDGERVEGRDGFVGYMHRHRSAFPDMTSEIEDVLVDGNRACVSYHRRGTHRGDLTTLDGSVVAASGRTFSFRTVDFMRFNRQGLVDELISVSNGDEVVAQLTD